jgi:hypothetical protein
MKTSRKAKGLKSAEKIKITKRTQHLIENKQNSPKTKPKTNPFWSPSEPNRTHLGPNRTHPAQVKLEGVAINFSTTINFSAAIDFFHQPCVSSQGARV